MRNRGIVVVRVVAAFAGGVFIGMHGYLGFEPAVMTGDASVGQSGMTIISGGTAYGGSRSVPWRDAAGTEHEASVPDCLSALGSVAGIPFAGAFVGNGDTKSAEVLWVDCGGG